MYGNVSGNNTRVYVKDTMVERTCVVQVWLSEDLMHIMHSSAKCAATTQLVYAYAYFNTLDEFIRVCNSYIFTLYRLATVIGSISRDPHAYTHTHTHT